MALTYYQIQLTSTSLNDGPSYSVFYSTSSLCDDYTFAGRVVLETTESIEYIQVDTQTTCIKLQSAGDCENFVVSGSQPETSSYSTHKVTLTEKNGAGPNFTLFQNTGSLYQFVKNAELAAGGHTTFEAGTPLNAVRLRSQGVCTNQKDVQVIIPPTPTPTPSPTPAPTPLPIYSYRSTKSAENVAVTYIDPYDVQRSFSHNSSLPRYFVGKSIISNVNSTIISSSGATPNTVYDSSSLDPFNSFTTTGGANGCTYLYYLSGSNREAKIIGPLTGGSCGPTLNDCIISGSLMGPTTWVTVTEITGANCSVPPPTPPPTAAPGQLYSYRQSATAFPVSVTYTDAFGNTQSFNHNSSIKRYFVGRNIQSSTNATIISQSNATPGNLIDSGGLDYNYSYNTNVSLASDWTKGYTYVTYVDETGQSHVDDVFRAFGQNLQVNDCMATHSLMIPNFTDVTSRVSFTQGTYCGIPPATPTPTPTATPVPTPAPNCYTFYTIYGSVNSATDACCNQFNTKPVFLDASSLATATTVYATNDCSTIRTTPTYYTQDLNNYYYWTGASLVGPTSCPGCP